MCFGGGYFDGELCLGLVYYIGEVCCRFGGGVGCGDLFG